MATLRKWRPVEPRRQASFLNAERMILFGGCATFGLAAALLLPPGERSEATASAPRPALHKSAATHAAQAQRAEAALRERERARLRIEHTREQAALFEERYNTDRTPTGAIENYDPARAAPPAVSPGFQEVKAPPASPGIREISGWKKSAR